jgi:serine/threonine-protein kinase
LKLVDSPELRDQLVHLFPALQIESIVPTPSNQRLVYFCSFTNNSTVVTQKVWSQWGPVVMKISQDVHPSIIARLEKEIEILNGLQTSYYPKLYYYDVFSEDPISEKPFAFRLFVTFEERIVGNPLSACRDNYRSEEKAAELLLQLVDALRLLWEHPQKIVHRDLKPENIMVRPDGSIAIIDLGILREEGSGGVTMTDQPFGPCTPAYASPEQARNEKKFITFKSDFFALGTILYELLTGANPFMHSRSEPLFVVLDRAQNYCPPTLKDLGKASGGFSNLIEQMMAKQPYQRQRTIDGLRSQLISLLRGQA